MMKITLLLLFVVAAMLTMPLPTATAQYRSVAREHTVTILDQADAPLRIVSARSVYESTSITSFAYWVVQSRVRHVADKPIIAYQLDWKLSNAFDEQVETINGVDSGPFKAVGVLILHEGFPAFAKGDQIDAKWEKVNLHGGTGVKATVMVSRVRFQDGAVWSASQ